MQVENGIEHLIYYLSHNLNDTEVKYSYVENISLAVVQFVQIFRHYILFRKTIVILDCNPMTYILSRQLLGGIFKIDRNFTGIWFGIHQIQVQEFFILA